RVRIVKSLEQRAWGDLPGEPPLVPTPAAVAFLSAVVDDRVPVMIGLRLVIGEDHETDGFVRTEDRPTVEADERTAEHSEVDCQLVPGSAVRVVRRGGIRRADMAVGERLGIELGGLAG